MSQTELPIKHKQGTDEEMLLELQRETFEYFTNEVDAETGLVADNTKADAPASVAAVGLALCTWTIGAERGFISRQEAVARTLRVLRFLAASPQGKENDACGYKGFYYHFLDRKTGRRAMECELSTIDTALLIAGAIVAARYFDRDDPEEKEIYEKAAFLYRRVEWTWALDGKATLVHGWFPESGFIPDRWDQGYSEALILYVLALGSPTFPIPENGYREWTSTFALKRSYGMEYLPAGPLFIHQMSQLWLDLRDLHDDFNRKVGFDYFENSRRATYVQRSYAIENPHRFRHYGEYCWGLTASDGPGPAELVVDGIKRVFYDYIARGAPDDIDDGTVSPWAAVASLPFAPKIVLCTIRHAIERLGLKDPERKYGFDASFNPTFPGDGSNPNGWVSPWRFGLNQGPIIIMIENYQSGHIWRQMRKCEFIQKGLARAGFVPVPFSASRR